jgi:opacity protein-like surface antigen
MQRGERTTTLALGYRIRPWLTLLLQRNTADLGKTAGYRFPLEWLTLRQWVTSYSTVAMVNAGVLHAGVGPAIHRLAVMRDEWNPAAEAKRTRIGLTARAGLTVPAHTRLFAEVALQYQLVGSMAFGPVAADSATTVARTRASFNYHALKLGVGFRL